MGESTVRYGKVRQGEVRQLARGGSVNVSTKNDNKTHSLSSVDESNAVRRTTTGWRCIAMNGREWKT